MYIPFRAHRRSAVRHGRQQQTIAENYLRFNCGYNPREGFAFSEYLRESTAPFSAEKKAELADAASEKRKQAANVMGARSPSLRRLFQIPVKVYRSYWKKQRAEALGQKEIQLPERRSQSD